MRRIRVTERNNAPARVLAVYTWIHGVDSYLYGSACWSNREPRWTWTDPNGRIYQVGIVGTDRTVDAIVLLENAQIGIIETGQLDAALADLGLRVAS